MEPEIAPRLVGRTKKSGLRHAWLNRPVMLAVPSALLFALASMDARAASSNVSQTAAPLARSYNIPSLPLGQALATYGKQTGVQVTYDPALLTGKTSAAVSGSMAPQDALQKLLSSSNLSYRYAGSNTIVIQKVAANITLGPVRVGGTVTHQDPTGPGAGYVATTTMAGTKTDTPLMEIPNSISVVTKQQMVDQQPQSVAQALRYSPGIMSESEGTYGNGSPKGADTGIMQRGFSTSQFVDGLMTNSTSSGETAFLERIEVVNGPASVMYGQTTPGGMIGMSLKKPTDTPLHQVSLGFGNWGRYEATFDISDKVTKSGNIRYRIAGIGVTQGTQTNYVDYHRVGVLPSLTWDIDNKTSLTLTGMYMYTPGEGTASQYPRIGTLSPNPNGQISRSTFLGEPSWNNNGNKDAMFEYQFKHKFNKYINFSQVFRWENSNWNQQDTYLKTGTLTDTTAPLQPMDYHTNTNTVGMDARFFGKFNTWSLNHTWVVGSDFRQYNYNSQYSYDYTSNPSVNLYRPNYSYSPCFTWNHAGCQLTGAVYNSIYFQEGIYFQDQIKWKRLSILLGGRQDWVNMKYKADSTSTNENTENVKVSQDYLSTDKPQPQSAFTWRSGLIYNFNFGLAPYFSYSTSFVPQIGSTNYQGHPFSPLTGKQLEAGLKYKVPNKDILLTAAAFHINEDHYLISDLEHTNYSTDAGRVKSQGFEIAANANITNDLKIIVSYSYTDIRYAKSNLTAKRYNPITSESYGNALSQEGMTVPYVPRNMFSFFSDYMLPNNFIKGLEVNFGARYTGFTYTDNVESFKTRPYILFDAGVHYDFGQTIPFLRGLTAQVAMSNLANTYYETRCSKTVCYLGQGRRIYGNLTYNW
ncbi:TonB-dependent siderophore receptor [Komagataeibacter sp. NFXK3]